MINAEDYAFDLADLSNLESTVYVFMCDPVARQQFSTKSPAYINALNQLMRETGAKGLYRLFDMGEQFDEIFAVSPERIYDLNQKLIHSGTQSKTLHLTSKLGTELSVDLTSASHWTSYDGRSLGFPPGEVAFYPRVMEGEVQFTGALLCGIPIGLKHGLIRDPISMTIRDARLQRIACSNVALEKDLNLFFGLNEGNKQIIEVGLGTNEGISRLYGRSATFEERFCGMHFGFGGEVPGSMHCDFIFDQCTIHFDEKLVFDGQYRI